MGAKCEMKKIQKPHHPRWAVDHLQTRPAVLEFKFERPEASVTIASFDFATSPDDAPTVILINSGMSSNNATLNALNEGRKRGQVNGARANRQKALKRLDAIIKCTEDIWSRNADLRYKVSATAVKIEKMKLSALRMQKGDFLGVDAIRKHLSAAIRKRLL